jgi:hypothetical protein
MNHSMLFLKFLTIGAVLAAAPAAVAAEWVKVTENVASDRFFVDQSSIQRQGDFVRYWEYREFPQPNDAFLEESVDQPVYGVVLNWSGDCTNNTQRLRQVTAYNIDRKVIQRFSYGDRSPLIQTQPGSSTNAVLSYVCAPKNASK